MADYDLVIDGGTIVDGTRFPRYRADIGVRGGRIAGIGNLARATASRRIDATGRIVAPGFVDSHTHFDSQMFWDPRCAPAGENGITSVTMANCGFGFAPCRPADRDRAMGMMSTTEQIPVPQLATGLPWDWETFPEFMESLRRAPKAINAMMFVPLNPLMVYVMGLDAAKTRRPTSAEIDTMKALVDEAMSAGAIGLSLSSMGTTSNHVDIDGQPMPTDRAHVDDMCAIAAVLKERGDGVCQITTEVGANGDSEISLRVAEACGRPLIHNILATSTRDPDMHRRAMKWLDAANGEGRVVYAASLAARAWTEQDFWNCPGTALDTMPVHRVLTIETPTLEGRMALAADPAYRARFRAEYDPAALDAIGGGLDGYIVGSMGDALPDDPAVGRTLKELADEAGVLVTDLYLDLALRSTFDMVIRTNSKVKNADYVAELIGHDMVLAGASDGGAHLKIFSGSGWCTDLLIWMVRDTGLKTLEEMHYRLSYHPAKAIGLQDRGALVEGMAADILVYDLDRLFFDESGYRIVHDMPGGDWRRGIHAGGYDWIVVNGEVTFDHGRPTAALPGRTLTVTDDLRDDVAYPHAIAAERPRHSLTYRPTSKTGS